jgi:hypothetical protein
MIVNWRRYLLCVSQCQAVYPAPPVITAAVPTSETRKAAPGWPVNNKQNDSVITPSSSAVIVPITGWDKNLLKNGILYTPSIAGLSGTSII